jgi:cardiolipin synthase
MKKLYRKIFSGLFLTVLVSILEISLIITILFLVRFFGEVVFDFWEINVEDKWGLIIYLSHFFFGMVEFIFFMVVVNKRENPEYKIPWITLIFVQPYLAFVIYLFFANHGLRRKEKVIQTQTEEILKEYYSVTNEEREEFKRDVPLRYRGIFKYLRHMTKMESTPYNKVTYYKNGELFFPALVEELKKAKEFIFMEFFIIGEGKWWSEIEEVLFQKASEGVEIRLLYDALGSFTLLPNNYARKLRRKGIKCYQFHKFKPMLKGTYNNRDHRKIAVIDHKRAFTGGMNLADEYANTIQRFGYWKDTMVKIEGPGIANLIATFLQNFDITCHKLSDIKKYIEFDYEKYDEEGYVYAFGDGPGGYSNNEPIGEENYIEIINNADRTLWISTPYLIPTYRLMEALKNAAKKGIDVKLIVPGVPDKKIVYWIAKSDFNQLIEAGVKVYVYTPGFNHEKQIVADGVLAFCGTINFDFRSLTHHFECGVTMYNVPCIKDMVTDFEEMEKASVLVKEGKKLNFIQSAIVAVIKVFRTLL